MVDIHSHFLHSVDDGAKDQDVMYDMLRQAREAGISALVASPHVTEHTNPASAEKIRSVYDSAVRWLADQDIGLQIYLGGEVAYDPHRISSYEPAWPVFGNEKKYLLFELPMFELPAGISETIFNLGVKQITPILAHPERNHKLREQPQQIVDWIHRGCLMQLDAGSITGQFGKSSEKAAMAFLQARAAHCVGSDAHEPKVRNYHILSEAYQIVKSKFSQRYADLIFKENPSAMVKDGLILKPSVDETIFEENFSQKILRKLNLFR